MPRLAVLILALLSLSACNQMLAERIVAPPNGGSPVFTDDQTYPKLWGVHQAFHVPVKNPPASLAVWILDPPNQTPRGTIFILHGIFAERVFVLNAARDLTSAGYRTVLVDLRGHGASSGDYVTYGVAESSDLSQILDELHRRNLIAGNVGVFGVSYGAATAIEWAGRDPRVSSVVAVAPFASMREEVPHYARTLLPFLAFSLSDADFQSVTTTAGQLAHFNPDDASPLRLITQTKAPILLLHGTNDWVIPIAQSRELHAANPNSQLIELPGQGHTTACLGLAPAVSRETQHWFNTTLAPQSTTSFYARSF